jgi:hypothetical protein
MEGKSKPNQSNAGTASPEMFLGYNIRILEEPLGHEEILPS